jgi:hypothetical protein
LPFAYHGAGDVIVKGFVAMVLLTAIDVGWLSAGNALWQLLHDRKASHRIDVLLQFCCWHP